MDVAIAKPRTRLRRWDLRKLGAQQLETLLLRTHRLEERLFTSIEPFEVYARRIRASDARHQWLWTESARPSVQYFLERNPDYRRGKALTILVPVTMATLATLAGRLTFSRIQKQWAH